MMNNRKHNYILAALSYVYNIVLRMWQHLYYTIVPYTYQYPKYENICLFYQHNLSIFLVNNWFNNVFAGCVDKISSQ